MASKNPYYKYDHGYRQRPFAGLGPEKFKHSGFFGAGQKIILVEIDYAQQNIIHACPYNTYHQRGKYFKQVMPDPFAHRLGRETGIYGT